MENKNWMTAMNRPIVRFRMNRKATLAMIAAKPSSRRKDPIETNIASHTVALLAKRLPPATCCVMSFCSFQNFKKSISGRSFTLLLRTSRRDTTTTTTQDYATPHSNEDVRESGLGAVSKRCTMMAKRSSQTKLCFLQSERGQDHQPFQNTASCPFCCRATFFFFSFVGRERGKSTRNPREGETYHSRVTNPLPPIIPYLYCTWYTCGGFCVWPTLCI